MNKLNSLILIIVLIALFFINILLFQPQVLGDFIDTQKFIVNSFLDGQMHVYSFIEGIAFIQLAIPLFVHAFLFGIVVFLDLTFLYTLI